MALSYAMNPRLTLALQVNSGVEDVRFETVWGQGHTTAERSGSSDASFSAWIGVRLA